MGGRGGGTEGRGTEGRGVREGSVFTIAMVNTGTPPLPPHGTQAHRRGLVGGNGESGLHSPTEGHFIHCWMKTLRALRRLEPRRRSDPKMPRRPSGPSGVFRCPRYSLGEGWGGGGVGGVFQVASGVEATQGPPGVFGGPRHSLGRACSGQQDHVLAPHDVVQVQALLWNGEVVGGGRVQACVRGGAAESLARARARAAAPSLSPLLSSPPPPPLLSHTLRLTISPLT